MCLFNKIFCLNVCACVCMIEQLEAFKKHMEAGETNTPAIIMGEENEDETENGRCQSVPDVHAAFVQSVCVTEPGSSHVFINIAFGIK